MLAALLFVAAATSASLVFTAPSSSAEPALVSWGLCALPHIGGRAGAWWSAERETEVFAYNISHPNAVGMTSYFWIEAGRGGKGRHFTDTSILRYYVDGEPEASIAGSVSMLAGSGVGLENASYYTLNQSASPRGSTECVNDANGAQDQCGMDMLDGWPWQTKWTGKVRIPFTSSLRVTLQAAPPVNGSVSSGGGYFIIRGIEGPEDQISVELGAGALRLRQSFGKGIRANKLRLRSHALSNHTPSKGEFIPLAKDLACVSSGVSGAALMLTVSLQGMHTISNDVEMCWWALTTADSSYSASDAHELLGTGMEDFFGNSFSVSNLARTYANDDAGLTHVHGGPQDDCSSAQHPFWTCPNHAKFPERFSAYRAFDKDPLLFSDKFEMAVRYLPPGKCSLAPSKPDASAAPTAAAPTSADVAAEAGGPNSPLIRTVVDSLLLYYTWERAPTPPPPRKTDDDDDDNDDGDDPCSLAGTYSPATRTCACYTGFTGSDCGALDLAPAKPWAQNGWAPADGLTSWGGSPVRGADGTFHLFASLNSANCSLPEHGVDCWPNVSIVVRTTSKYADGPYSKNYSVILPHRSPDFFDGDATQNPVVLSLRDGSLVLYYVGLSCAGPSRGGPYSWKDCQDSANSSIGVAHAPRPEGPWTRSDRTILAAARPLGFEGDATANPAAWEQDDGSVLFAYRGRHDEVQVLPLATAPSWRGPYQRLLRNGSSAFNSSCSTQLCNATICLDRMEAGPGIFNISQRGDPDQRDPHTATRISCLEDPFLFRIKSGSYHMIMHNQARAHVHLGAHAYSAGGKRWRVAKTEAYSRTQQFSDGTSIKLYRREEPKLLFQDGSATHLFSAACPNNVECGHVLAVPLKRPIQLWERPPKTPPPPLPQRR